MANTRALARGVAMTIEVTKARSDVLERFATHAQALFAARPERRSVLLVVAQFTYAIEGEIHVRCVLSQRPQPIWPHECHDTEDYGQEATHPGEECNWCSDDVDLIYDGAFTHVIAAFGAFCASGANEDMDLNDAYRPYAVARRCDDGVTVDVIGGFVRAPAELLGVPPADDPFADKRAAALLAQVHARPRDDAARAVLADHLHEQQPGDRRAEMIALALAGMPHDELLAPNVARWIAPLGAVIPPGGARFERGFLARADVLARDDATRERVRGARAWGTVEQLRYLPGSLDVIDPAMRALRDVGPVGDAGIAALVKARRHWAIERLHAAPATPAAIAALRRARTLPRLRELVIDAQWLPELFGAPSRLRLERLVLLASLFERLPPAAWRDHRASLGVPWLAIVEAGEDGLPAGWEIAFGPDERVALRMVGWHAQATLQRLADLARLAGGRVELVSTPFFTFTGYDVDYVREHAGDQRIATAR